MPELPVKEARPSELHLPEIKREEIVRALSEIKRPDIDLTRIERPNIDLSSRSIGRAVTALAVALRLAPRTRRPRWPFAVAGLVVAGVAAAAILSNAAVRARLSGGAAALRERVTAMRSGDAGTLDVGSDDAVAFASAETAKIEASPFTDATAIDATGYPTGLGIDQNGNQIPEEAAARD
jgi:hypothetical protein